MMWPSSSTTRDTLMRTGRAAADKSVVGRSGGRRWPTGTPTTLARVLSVAVLTTVVDV
jgi:hypothetical protein